MFKTFYAARLDANNRRKVQLFCWWKPPASATRGNDLPAPENLATFCYPHGPENVQPKEYMAPEEYSFTLTSGDGTRLHGFCRRFLPRREKTGRASNNNLRYPQVLCLISEYAWFPLFYKVLQVMEQLLKQTSILLDETPTADQLQPTHPGASFLEELFLSCPDPPVLGRVLRVNFPINVSTPLSVSPCRHIGAFSATRNVYLQSTDKYLELEIPPDCGNGPWNAGIPLAVLLWNMPAAVVTTLLASLLLERRVILTAEEGSKLSSVVHAAAAFLYPFRWQHIYLPLLPASLMDYLTSPIPFLVGLPARFLPALKDMPLDEVTIIDLDLGRSEPESGSRSDDGRLLPWRKRLTDGFKMIHSNLMSPTEFESTPMIAALVQEYFLKLLGNYRRFIVPDDADADAVRKDEDTIRAHGYRLDQSAFIASQRNEKQRNFLRLLSQSQMFEVFVNERLELASRGYTPLDAWEIKVQRVLAQQRPPVAAAIRQKIPKPVTAAANRGVSTLSSVLNKSSVIRESMAERLKTSSFKAQQTLKAYTDKIEGQLSRLPTRSSSHRVMSESGGAAAQRSSSHSSTTTGTQPRIVSQREGEHSFFPSGDTEDIEYDGEFVPPGTSDQLGMSLFDLLDVPLPSNPDTTNTTQPQPPSQQLRLQERKSVTNQPAFDLLSGDDFVAPSPSSPTAANNPTTPTLIDFSPVSRSRNAPFGQDGDLVDTCHDLPAGDPLDHLFALNTQALYTTAQEAFPKQLLSCSRPGTSYERGGAVLDTHYMSPAVSSFVAGNFWDASENLQSRVPGPTTFSKCGPLATDDKAGSSVSSLAIRPQGGAPVSPAPPPAGPHPVAVGPGSGSGPGPSLRGSTPSVPIPTGRSDNSSGNSFRQTSWDMNGGRAGNQRMDSSRLGYRTMASSLALDPWDSFAAPSVSHNLPPLAADKASSFTQEFPMFQNLLDSGESWITNVTNSTMYGGHPGNDIPGPRQPDAPSPLELFHPDPVPSHSRQPSNMDTLANYGRAPLYETWDNDVPDEIMGSLLSTHAAQEMLDAAELGKKVSLLDL